MVKTTNSADFLEVYDRFCMYFLLIYLICVDQKKVNQIRISTMYINGTDTV